MSIDSSLFNCKPHVNTIFKEIVDETGFLSDFFLFSGVGSEIGKFERDQFMNFS